MKKHLLAGLALLGAVCSAPASATVALGDLVTCGTVNLDCSNADAIVNGNVEFGIESEDFGTLFLADFSAGLLTVSFADNPNVAGGIELPEPFALIFSNETNPFTTAVLGDVFGVRGLNGSSLSLDGGFLTINLSNTAFDPGSSLQVKFDGTVTPPTTGAVPEPATWAMMILGFALVGFAMRRRPLAMLQPRLA